MDGEEDTWKGLMLQLSAKENRVAHTVSRTPESTCVKKEIATNQ